MNTPYWNHSLRGPGLGTIAAASLLLAACAGTPVIPQGATEARTKLNSLQSDSKLADRAPAALKEAEVAVRAAEQPVTKKDAELGAYRVYMADRKVEIAMAMASTQYSEDQRVKLADERDRARLAARTSEADAAHAEVTVARNDAASARSDADELQKQIDALQAEATDRGLVLTLGDVLFATGRSEVKVGATSNLNKLVAFLNKYPDRKVQIEGYTDNVGSEDSNQGLSQRRAESVRSYLVQQGISSARLSAIGMGEGQPVADNGTQSGRQQNRRVVAVIENPPSATASTK